MLNSITDQITDQDMPYRDVLDYVVYNTKRVLAQIHCLSRENNSPLGTIDHLDLSFLCSQAGFGFLSHFLHFYKQTII